MKLKNDALQELYDTIINGTITILPLQELYDTILPYDVSPIDMAFRECDNKLSESITFEQIKKLKKDLDDAKKSQSWWRSRAKHTEEEVEELKATLTELQNNCKAYDNLSEENRK